MHDSICNRGQERFKDSLKRTHFSASFEAFDTDLASLEDIAEFAFHCSSVDLCQLEAETLQQLHEALFKTGMCDKILDMFNFCNFSRDCVCSLEQMNNIFFKQLNLGGQISQKKLAILLQHYTLPFVAQSKSPASGQSIADVRNQSLNFYPLLKDLGYTHRGLGMKDQKYA